MASAEFEDRTASACRVVAGLGNPGESYRATRHNVGFRVVEEMARRRGWVFSREECASLVAAGDRRIGNDRLLVKPQTFMNRSGHALRCFAERLEIEPSAFLVVYDEVHLPLGKLRLRGSGSPAGHRGLESVLESLGSDQVPRLRLGVGVEPMPAGAALPDFVLAPFAGEEREGVEAMINRAADACEAWLDHGLEWAMSRVNG